MVDKQNDNTMYHDLSEDTQTDQSVSRPKRRQYGKDTESGIAYREQLAKDRAEQAASDRKLNKRLTIAVACVCAVVLGFNITGIVTRSKNLSLLSQTVAAKQAELKEIEENPRHETIKKEADVINAHEIAQYICDCQNELAKYVFEEAKTGAAMSRAHIDLIEDYNIFTEKIDIRTSDLPMTWLSKVIDPNTVSKSPIDKLPYTWVCDNDYDLISTDVKIVWKCYLYYGTEKQEFVMSVMANYSTDTDTISQFEIYQSDSYSDVFKNSIPNS